MLSAIPSLLDLLDHSEAALVIQRLTERYDRLLDVVHTYSVRHYVGPAGEGKGHERGTRICAGRSGKSAFYSG